MRDEDKTKAQLIGELRELRRRLSELERGGTGRASAGEELALERDRAQEYLDVAGVMLLALNPRGEIALINRKGCEILGCAEEEILGRNWFDCFLPQEVGEETKRVFNEIMAGELELVEYHENPILCKDGEIRIIAWHNAALTDEEGRIIGTLSSGEDITERRRAEEELRRRDAFYSSIIEKATEGLLVMDAGGNLRYVSPRTEEMLGLEPGELAGRNAREFFELIHADDLDDVNKVYREAFDTPGMTARVEFRARRGDGAWRVLEVVATNLLQDPAVAGMVIRIGIITDRKRVEEELRKSRETARSILDATDDSAFLLRPDGTVLAANRAAARRLGVEVRELVGKNGFDFIPPEVAARRRAAVEEVVRTGEAAELEDERGGIYFRSVFYPLIDERGKVDRIVVFGRDITAVKRAEEELRESEERYKNLYTSMKEGLCLHEIIYDRAGRAVDYRIVDVNPAYETILDIKREEAVGALASRLYGTGEPPFLDIYAEVAATGKPTAFETYFPPMEKHFSISAFRPAKGRFATIFTDITERKRARERLERLNHLFLSLGVDLIGNMERIIEAARDILGGEMANYCRMDRERLLCALSTAPGEVLKPAGRPGDHVCYEVMRGGGRTLAIEDLDGTSYPETDPYVKRYGLKSFLGCPVVLEGRTIGCLSLFDKTRREFTHEEEEILGTLARALAIEEERLAREESMKNFIDIASHELRHPVTLMKGYAISLKELRDRLDQEQRGEMLEAIVRGSDRLNRLVLGLLDLSRIERGRFRIEKQEAELAPLVEQAVDELLRGGAKNRFELSVPDALGRVRVDPERLVELLVILLENAAKFSPPASRIDVEVAPEGAGVMVSVLDRGMGVPEEYRELIFERFTQVEDALHHSIPGMGMGLYIAREIVEAHGGKIWCEPRQGGGTAFRFTLPS